MTASLRSADYETTLTHLSVVHGAGDCSEIAKGDFDSRLSMGPIGRRAGAILGNREGADVLSRRVAVLEAAPAGGEGWLPWLVGGHMVGGGGVGGGGPAWGSSGPAHWAHGAADARTDSSRVWKGGLAHTASLQRVQQNGLTTTTPMEWQLNVDVFLF